MISSPSYMIKIENNLISYWIMIWFSIGACSPSPCYNGGTCTVVDGGPQCECPPGYSGDVCEESKF